MDVGAIWRVNRRCPMFNLIRNGSVNIMRVARSKPRYRRVRAVLTDVIWSAIARMENWTSYL